MSLEQVIEKFCSLPCVEGEQPENAEIVAEAGCSPCSRRSHSNFIDNAVTCNACEYFTPDNIGDGAGIGRCKHDIKWTEEVVGRMSLYRYANRHCDRFIMR